MIREKFFGNQQWTFKSSIKYSKINYSIKVLILSLQVRRVGGRLRKKAKFEFLNIICSRIILQNSITMLLDNKKRYKESGSLWLDFYLLPKTNVLFEKKGLVMWSEFFKHKNWYLRVLWVLTYNHIHTPSLGFCVMIFFCHLLVRSTGCIGTVLWF